MACTDLLLKDYLKSLDENIFKLPLMSRLDFELELSRKLKEVKAVVQSEFEIKQAESKKEYEEKKLKVLIEYRCPYLIQFLD